jgi:hypothetical protein
LPNPNFACLWSVLLDCVHWDAPFSCVGYLLFLVEISGNISLNLVYMRKWWMPLTTTLKQLSLGSIRTWWGTFCSLKNFWKFLQSAVLVNENAITDLTRRQEYSLWFSELCSMQLHRLWDAHEGPLGAYRSSSELQGLLLEAAYVRCWNTPAKPSYLCLLDNGLYRDGGLSTPGLLRHSLPKKKTCWHLTPGGDIQILPTLSKGSRRGSGPKRATRVVSVSYSFARQTRSPAPSINLLL